jgi:diacylglycerol kinase (ATP)
MKIICILNPLAADGACLKMWPVMESLLKNEGVEYEIIQHEGDLREKVQNVLETMNQKQNIREVVIAGLGGDGTHHALINGMMNFQKKNPDLSLPPYAIIPFGTGNNIAKSFGLDPGFGNIKPCLELAVKTALHGKEHQVDLGKVDGRWFLDAFTVGLDAYILAGRNLDRAAFRKNSLAYRLFKGYPLYLYNTIKSLWKCHPVHAEITVDGKKWYSGDFFNLVINNTSIYAGELDLADSAPADDGLLDAVVFSGSLNYLRRYLLGHRYLPKQVRTLSSKARQAMEHIRGGIFEIKLGKPVLCQIAGEELSPGDSFKVETFPGILMIKKL